MATQKEESFENLFKAMSLLNFQIGTQFYAKPTYIVDPHDFYIVPFPFIYHLPSLSKPGNPFQTEDLKENIVVIFQSNNPDVNVYFKINLDDHIRGVIQTIDDDKKCNIYALDRGFIEKAVSIDRIYHPACDDATNTPSLVRRCELDSCHPIGANFNDESIEAFKYYIGNEKLSIVVRGQSIDKLKVIVYNSNPDDIGTLLALTHYTHLACDYRDDGNAMTVDGPYHSKLTYQHISLSVGETLNVRVQSGTSLESFYVMPVSAYRKYLQNRGDFTNFCRSIPEIASNDFKAGTVVGVQEDTSLFYERAIILEVTEPEKARVKLVDWGTEIEVPRSRIKTLKTEFYLTSPAYALYCAAVDGFEPWDNGLSNFLYRGYTFEIKVIKEGKGFETPHIVALAQT